MKLGVLFSGGKDSTYATWIAKEEGYDIACLISIYSKNLDSYMFHTPSIEKTKNQAEVMEIPLIIEKTEGIKEKELKELEKAIRLAKEKYGISGIVTGAVESVYQATRVQKICDKLDLECFNPLWQKPEEEILRDLIKNNFKVILTSVAGEGFDKTWIGREIDSSFIKDIKELNQKYGISLAGEGGEFETFVLNCPLFEKGLEVVNKEISGESNAWKMEVSVE